MKRKNNCEIIGKAAFVLAALTMFGGCNAKDASTESSKPIEVIESVVMESAEVKESEDTQVSEEVEESTNTETEVEEVVSAVTGRKDGERFEHTIMIEGMEETVQYEHVINEEIGFEMDYEYDSLEREKGDGIERLVSIYDDPNDPENYLEVTFSEENVEDVANAIKEELSKGHTVLSEYHDQEGEDGGIMLLTTQAKEDCQTPNRLQMVYVFPASEGSLIATAHFTMETMEGFGSRFSQIMHTIVLIEKQ